MKYDFDKINDRRNTYCLKYDFAEERGKPSDVIPLWVADMDIRTPEAVTRALKQRAEQGIFGYTMPKEDYFRIVADWFKTRHGFDANPSDFICTPGVVFALCTLIRAVTAPGDGVIICQPVYYPFESSVRNNGRKTVVSRLVYKDGRYSVDFDDFEAKIVQNNVKAFILCSPHNPVGRVWTRAELLRMGEICLRHGVFVISDEIHADFTYGKKHLIFPSVDERFADNCAVCTAPSKTFNLAGLQISHIYIPNKDVRKAFELELDKVGYWEPNVMGLTAAAAAYKDGADWLDALKEYLAENLAFTREYIAANIPGIELVEPEGTYLLWLDCRKLGLDDGKLTELVEQKARLWLDDGYIFGEGGSGFERINIACPRSTLEKALSQLARAVKSYTRGG